ncbi:MAG: hypothetical protein WDZ40_02795 [Candidatus Spechtbacterales bacterium]
MKKIFNTEFYSEQESEGGKEGSKKLHELEKMGKYVFHGSPVGDIEELEPRQAHNYKEGEEPQEDGPPAVVASPYADIAIFRALVRKDKTGFESDGKGNLHFRASSGALKSAKDAVGYVYVFDKTNFQPKAGAPEASMGWRSEHVAKSLFIVEVHYNDLALNNIEIIEN